MLEKKIKNQVLLTEFPKKTVDNWRENSEQ